MPIYIHILDASGKLKLYKKQLRIIAQSVIRIAENKLSLKKMDIVFKTAKANNPDLKRIGGIGGYCPSSEYVQIDLDPTIKYAKKNLDRNIKRTLTHELHHAARYSTKHFGDTFLDALIAEGLADYFVFESFGFFPEWIPNLKDNALKRLIRMARREFDRKDFSYEEWFTHGSKKRGIPRWSGYALGRHLVQNFLQRHPNGTASSFYDKSAESFLDTD